MFLEKKVDTFSIKVGVRAKTVIVTSLQPGWSGFQILVQTTNFISETSLSLRRPTILPVKGYWYFCPRLKKSSREVNHSPPSISEVKNE